MTTETLNPLPHPEDPLQDQNYVSFLKDRDAGALTQGVFVAYKDGEFAGQSDNRDALIEALEEYAGPVFLTQVGVDEVLDIPRFDIVDSIDPSI